MELIKPSNLVNTEGKQRPCNDCIDGCETEAEMDGSVYGKGDLINMDRHWKRWRKMRMWKMRMAIIWTVMKATCELNAGVVKGGQTMDMRK